MNKTLGRAFPPGSGGPTTASSTSVEPVGEVAPGSGIVEPTPGRGGSPAPVGTPAPPTIPRFPRGAAPNGVASPKENTAPSASTSQYPAPVCDGRSETMGPAPSFADRRAADAGAAEGEDPPVRRHQPVATPGRRGRHPHDRPVEPDGAGRAVERRRPEAEDAAVGGHQPVAVADPVGGHPHHR